MVKKEVSDNQETIDRASKASGSRKMLEDLAKKMQAGHDKCPDCGHPRSAHEFHDEMEYCNICQKPCDWPED